MDWKGKLNNLCFMINSIKKLSLSVLGVILKETRKTSNENLQACYSRKGKMILQTGS